MKKLTLVISVALAALIVSAAPRSASLASCLWHLVSGESGVIANENESVKVDPAGYVLATGGFFAQWLDGSYIDLEPTYFEVTGPNGAGVVFQPNSGTGGTPYGFDTEVEHTSGALVNVENNHTAKFTVYHDGSVVTGDGSRWLLGSLVEDRPVSAPSTNKYVSVTIGGQVVKLAVVE